MARKRSSTRKLKATTITTGSHHSPYRLNKHVSASPSVASSPSPQPHDLVQRRRKGTPVRSPSQGDTSKGIVFAFRIQPDSDLSMAVDIRRYDQVSEEPESSVVSSSAPANSSSSESKAITEQAAPSIASTGAAIAPAGSISGSSNSDGRESSSSTAVSTELKLAGEMWSSDPNSYLSNNVVDLTRNVLILHSRKPQDTQATAAASSSTAAAAAYPYSRSAVPSRSSSMSLPSTPPLTDSPSSYSSASSSPSSSPSSPTLEATLGEKENSSFTDKLSSALPLSLPLPDPMVADLKSQQAPRMLRVRGLGAGSRRMQVFVV